MIIYGLRRKLNEELKLTVKRTTENNDGHEETIVGDILG